MINSPKILILLGVVSLFIGGHTVNAQDAEKTNVIMVVIDDLRTELGCYGVDAMHSPSIDRFAQKSMLFNHAYAQYPVCNPSRSSFLSGLRPDEVGIISNTVPLRRVQPNLVTLPQLFRENGYFTAGIGKIFHLSVDHADERALFVDPLSWDYFFDALDGTTKTGRQGAGRNLTNGKIPWATWKAAAGDDADQPDGINNLEVLKVLEDNHERPFFIGYGIHKPHDPFIAPKKYFEFYPEGRTQLAEEPEGRSKRIKMAIPNDRIFAEFTDQERREFKRAYQAGVSFADAQVGKLMDRLDQLELWDSTIVIIMGDHGYHLGEHDWWNKVTVFEDGARAPMLIWVPDALGMGKPTDSLMEFIDLYPTLVDYAGLAPPHKLSGASLRPVLEDPNASVKEAAYTQVTRGPKVMGRSVRTRRWRYTEWGEGKHGVELYDHSKDSGEYYNLSANPEYAHVVSQMKQLLQGGLSGE
ncbi:MAG: sulfatase [Opitutales bacterium]